VLDIAAGFDHRDVYSKRLTRPSQTTFKTIGVPRADQLEFFGDVAYAALFEQVKSKLVAQDFILVDIDFSPFIAAAQLLYAGPWVAERYHAIAQLLSVQPDEVLSVIRQIVEPARLITAEQTFQAFYQLAAYKRQGDDILATVDAILTPTTGTIYTLEQMQANPLVLNSNLGYYTNFMNLLDYAALAVPAGQRPDGLPFGITFFSPSGQDWNLLDLAQRWAV
jgi:allophanate hydrolase